MACHSHLCVLCRTSPENLDIGEDLGRLVTWHFVKLGDRLQCVSGMFPVLTQDAILGLPLQYSYVMLAVF